MKTISSLFSMLALMGVLAACNNSGGGGGTATTPGSCGAGMVNSQYGCIPQGNCGVGMGMYQNQCVMVNNTNTTCTYGSVPNGQGQCVPTNYSYNNGYFYSYPTYSSYYSYPYYPYYPSYPYYYGGGFGGGFGAGFYLNLRLGK